jgi:hypothetical protein
MSGLSLDIPEPIKRQLRQEAGFGCCVCGNPVFQYHHIHPRGSVSSHDPAQMLVLCPNHHHEATIGALTEDEQRRWRGHPENMARGYVDGLLKVTSRGVAVHVGTNDFVGPGFKFVVDGEPLLALDADESGRLQLSLDLYDSSDSLLATIHRNEWSAGDPLPWDIEFSHRRLQLRRKRSELTLSINATEEPLRLRGQLWRHEQLFEMDAAALRFNGVGRNVSFVELGFVGMYLSADTTTGSFQIVPEPRFGQAMFVIWPDRAERLEKCFAALQQLEEKAV